MLENQVKEEESKAGSKRRIVNQHRAGVVSHFKLRDILFVCLFGSRWLSPFCIKRRLFGSRWLSPFGIKRRYEHL
jgi:ABC-type antimicrobial peptide transport system permease subunit